MTDLHIPPYLDFVSAPLLEELWARAEGAPATPGLRVAPGLRARFPHLLTDEALRFVCQVYADVHPELRRVLEQRVADRAFIDAEVALCHARSAGVAWTDPARETVLGKVDGQGRVVVGPRAGRVDSPPIVVPDFLKGEQVTLFGPPDTRKMSINAMGALHRRLPGEAPIVARLVEESGQVPRWGADDEDSKTPIMEDFLHACENLIGCFDRTLSFTDPGSGRRYTLPDSGLSLPIKRVPGLALPDTSHLIEGNPLPLHLVDLCLHLFHNARRPEALVFYVPKLENEEEAAYLAALLTSAERHLAARCPGYAPGTVHLLIVFENPRAIFRIREIAAALHPWFVGGSLGWHDFLASTARLLKNEPDYRIPVKGDPNIVIHHIKASHQILVKALAPLGGIAIGGMYGVLYEDGDPRSFLLSMVGYVKDVITQLRRGLNGFWVAHPSFVRIGIALVQAWRRREADPADPALDELLVALVQDEVELEGLRRFITGEDAAGLGEDHPLYLRGVIVADLAGSQVISNEDPEEVRYNIFQALQYLADWLRGNGCVALPAQLRDSRGGKAFVRVMDDLATTERSRWELWAEIHHGRVPRALFEEILAQELTFLRRGEDTDGRRIQVRWEGELARWYPIAVQLLRQLVLDPSPVEFVTQLLLPFTIEEIRSSPDPLARARALCPGRYPEW